MAPLRLRILAAPAGVVPPALPTFAAAGTIGRSETNTLVLPDPSIQMSRQHCRLEPGPAGGWQVADLSANGTFVNDALVGRGSVRPLSPGDRLRLGDWVIAVEGGGDGGALPPPSAEGDPLDPFGIGDISRARPAPPVATPLPPRVDRPDPLFGAAPDPFGPGSGPSPFAIPGIAGDPFGAATPFGPPGGTPSAGVGPAPPDPFAMPPLAPAGPEPPLPQIPPALAGGIDSMSVPLPQPAGAPPGGGLPDDWMDEALSGLAPKPAVPTPAPPPQPLPQPSPPPAGPAVSPLAGGSATAGLAAFAEGAGIAPPAGIAPEAALVELGRATRLLARSMMRLLAARRAVKSEFRISQTVVAARENNPLKFSADEAEMVCLLLGLARPGFQAGSVAVADACRDLEAHQLALLAAFRAVIGQILARLDPQTLGAEEEAGLLGRLTGAGKGMAWDAYVKAHADLKQDFSESLRGRLAQVFAEAYEAESRRAGGS